MEEKNNRDVSREDQIIDDTTPEQPETPLFTDAQVERATHEEMIDFEVPETASDRLIIRESGVPETILQATSQDKSEMQERVKDATIRAGRAVTQAEEKAAALAASLTEKWRGSKPARDRAVEKAKETAEKAKTFTKDVHSGIAAGIHQVKQERDAKKNVPHAPPTHTSDEPI
jgi:uncharacterized protein (UPF0147 family)